MTDMLQAFERFKNREIRANDIFTIREITKIEAYDFVRKYHYLGDAKFFCAQAFGLFYKPTDELVGCATYQQPQGIVALKSWFNLPNSCTDIYELGRLCMLPSLNGSNATSFLLGGSLRCLRRQGTTRAVITLATSDRHVGSIYQVCNFEYFGLSDKKTDFYCADGRKNPRGPTKDLRGVWIERPQKHRYAYILDPTLKVNYPRADRPPRDHLITNRCCGGTGIVKDSRFGDFYTCPICTGVLTKIGADDAWML